MLSHPSENGKDFVLKLGMSSSIACFGSAKISSQGNLGGLRCRVTTLPGHLLLLTVLQTLSLDAPAADTELTIPSEKSQEVHVGLSWTEALGNWTNHGVEFSGLWLDKNEVSSFQCTGSCGERSQIQDITPPALPPRAPVTAYPEG